MSPKPPTVPGELTDPEDFGHFFREHHPLLLHWFLRQGLGRPSSEELAQDTMLAAFKGRGGFRGEASAKTWLLHIARNTYRNHLRDQKTKKRAAATVPLDLGPSPEGGWQEISDEKAVEPDVIMVEEERARSLHAGLEELPPQMRQSLELRLQDLKYREIATIMGVSIETVKSHLHQARQRLRDFFKASEEGEPRA